VKPHRGTRRTAAAPLAADYRRRPGHHGGR